MTCDDCREALGAYVDGELMPAEAEMIRVHLASCRECAAEHETLLAISHRVRAGLERRLAPETLKARIRSALASSVGLVPTSAPRSLPWAGLIAAGLVVAIVSAGGSFAVARRNGSAPAIEQQVLATHIRSLMPGHLTDVQSNDTHNVKPWFNGRIDLSPAVPRLDTAGFPLIGGRLDYVGGRPVAAVVYMRRQHVINVFSWPIQDAAARPATVSTEKGYHLVQWSEGGVEFWAASDLNIPELTHFIAMYSRSEPAK